MGESDLSTADYSRPSRTCDVVMKGGITSGVVYPHAVCTLAETYRFRNVGGTSAGAIAAAATAAAEYGRERGGFRKLAALPNWIGSDGNLLGLFQPQAKTASLYAVLIGALEGGPVKASLVALRRNPLAALAGGALGLALLVLSLVRGLGDGFDALVVIGVLAGLALTVLGAVLGILARLARQLTRGVADNGFGLCSGGPGVSELRPPIRGPKFRHPRGGRPALTPWLTALLNETAGLPPDEPLTFGHLWAGPGGDHAASPADPADRQLQLAMMTTNLVNRRAHRLPWDSHEWFFDPDEFRALFPDEVVDWMVAHPPQDLDQSEQAKAKRQGALPRLPLPAAADLPVVVATRMSLSFPVLLSGVPLWRFDYTRPAPRTLERCWFSDGGISSNFPVHFFDRLVPRWPTFAINLRPFALGETPSETDEATNTSMVTTNTDGIADWWYRLPERPGGLGLVDKRLLAFLMSAVRTMQNRLDEAQMRVPGYRDRVAHVSLADKEGGMNLTMPPTRIEALTKRGRAAAERLRDAYTPPGAPGQKITWDNHRWVRLRSSLAVLETMHDHFADGYSQAPASPDEMTYAELLGRDSEAPPKSYPWKGDARGRLASEEIEAILHAVAAKEDAGCSVADGAPRPAPEGRIAPTD